jgi:hypothetical protein
VNYSHHSMPNPTNVRTHAIRGQIFSCTSELFCLNLQYSVRALCHPDALWHIKTVTGYDGCQWFSIVILNIYEMMSIFTRCRIVENSGHSINSSPSANNYWTMLQTFFIGVLQVIIINDFLVTIIIINTVSWVDCGTSKTNSNDENESIVQLFVLMKRNNKTNVA